MLSEKEINDILSFSQYNEEINFESIINRKEAKLFNNSKDYHNTNYIPQIIRDLSITFHQGNSLQVDYDKLIFKINESIKKIMIADSYNIDPSIIDDYNEIDLNKSVIEDISLCLFESIHDIKNINDKWKNFNESKNDFKFEDLSIEISSQTENIDKNINDIKNIRFFADLNNDINNFMKKFDKFCSTSNVEKRSIFLKELKASIKDEYRSFSRLDNSFSEVIKNIKIKDYLKNILKIEKEIYEKFIDKDNYGLINSVDFIINKHINDQESFMRNKKFLEKKKKHIILPEINIIKEIIKFEDRSIVIKNRDDSYSLINSHAEFDLMLVKLFSKNVEDRLKNKPFIAKEILRVLEIQPDQLENALPAIDTFLKYEDILKNEKFDIIDKLRKSYFPDFEDLDDEMNKIVSDHKLKKFAHSITSNKYHHLYNELSYNILRELSNNNFDNQKLQNFIGKKIASFKTSEDFNSTLQKILDDYNSFELEKIKDKVQNAGATIVLENDKKIIIKIDDFEQSKILGSSSWCIVRHHQYFNSYTQEGNTQYFMYDFKKDPKDNLSIVGFTLDKEGKIYAAHKKDDSELENSEKQNLEKNIIPKIRLTENVKPTLKKAKL